MTHNLRTEPQTLQRMFENIGESSRTAGVTSRHNRGAAVEADTIRKQQLKRTQAASSSCEVDAVMEQQLKQSGNSSSAKRAVRRRIVHTRMPEGKLLVIVILLKHLGTRNRS